MKTPRFTKEYKILSVSSLFFIQLFNSCKDKEQFVYNISQETKDYCVFQTSTWWEYENINTHEVDTYFITKVENKINPKEDDERSSQEININYKRTLNNNEFVLTINNIQWGTDLLFLLGENHKNQPQQIVIQYFEMKDTVFAYSSDSITLIKHQIEYKLSLTRKSYPTVKEFVRKNNINNLLAKKTYWAKHIGVIRREMFDGSIWELKSYNIIQ